MKKETLKTKITLLSWTQHPLETIYAQWVQSRTQGDVPLPETIAYDIEMVKNGTIPSDAAHDLTHLEAHVLDVFQKVVDMKMPLGETIDFVFLVEHMPVALREQMVRHRIGHKFGDRLGADIIPDLAGNSTFWSQTTRIVDMGQFAKEGDYFAPLWLEDHGEEPMPGFKVDLPNRCPKCLAAGTPPENVQMEMGGIHGYQGRCSNGHTWHKEDYVHKEGTIEQFYHEQMAWIAAAYQRLVKAGMPLEDARNILPVAMQHRMSWKVNFSSLMHVLSRRGCWLAQLGMWRPVIEGIIEELAIKIHPTFRRLIDPPCFNSRGEYDKCAFGKENSEIISQGDYPPCSLWVNKDGFNEMYDKLGPAGEAMKPKEFEDYAVGEARMPRYRKMQERYAQLWQRDPVTGERRQVS